jgi:hypothetical protein
MLHPGFLCGSSLTINHVAGVVAPVNKTVTYGTVTNIPGEPSKCWITSNLGADHQATAKSDATEQSAGWYWQFNRKQGYKHTGSVRTPNTWITSIEEDFDWQAANDPCTLELGAGWRIPTSLEWTNVDASGNWTNWNGPWNSALKMHAAGCLGDDGSLYDRGSEGSYWSGTTFYTGGICLGFNSSGSGMGEYIPKTLGTSIRCIRYGNASAAPTVTTTSMTDIARTSATSGGVITNDGGAFVTARGVCWSTSQNPTINDNHTSDGTGTGSFMSHLANLAPNTPYYVRAYASTSFGTGYGNEVPFTTLSFVYTCDSSVTANHVAGAVAPVNKTVTYGIAGNIPGEISKCWITSNLGADHQATAVTDATETSAGWYWQFNRKQGYKHTGSIRTPNTTWITSINENFNWQPDKDPCTLELGAGWRIPTNTEWENVRLNGNWDSVNGPWNSDLKLHAAGILLNNNGSLFWRGTSGAYWSSTQFSTTLGKYMGLSANHHGEGITYYDYKTYGRSMRCLREAGTATLPTVTTSGITDIAQTTATGGGEVTADGGAEVTARGVCWSTLPNPTTADSLTSDGTGTGAFVSNLIGLTPSTPYYVRAYATNSVGTAYGDEVSFTTLPAAFSCGTSLTVNHIAGAVAPVNKTVTYGTVTNIPGETAKCWITSNLGADHQATAKNDATEASAGWYWQFNRKQGYKHTGTVRTPNTTWITTINENSDWMPANDPCALELGAGWRIPSDTEWINVVASGNWINWNGPWNSALKMHAAGYIAHQDATLQERGICGGYWSSTQYSATQGEELVFWQNGYDTAYGSKADGNSARCIKE